MCKKNGGLYIKMGQGIASMNHVLPPQYLRRFVSLQDRAPTTPWSEVERMLQEELQGSADELFDTFDEEPAASASIAQVHRATINGEQLAVKVQHPHIASQMPWDLACYRWVWAGSRLDGELA